MVLGLADPVGDWFLAHLFLKYRSEVKGFASVVKQQKKLCNYGISFISNM